MGSQVSQVFVKVITVITSLTCNTIDGNGVDKAFCTINQLFLTVNTCSQAHQRHESNITVFQIRGDKVSVFIWQIRNNEPLDRCICQVLNKGFNTILINWVDVGHDNQRHLCFLFLKLIDNSCQSHIFSQTTLSCQFNNGTIGHRV